MSNTTSKTKKPRKKSTRSSRTSNSKLTYTVKTVKKQKDIQFEVWQEKPKGRLKTFDFKKDAKELADFHNKNQVWSINGGIPNFLLD